MTIVECKQLEKSYKELAATGKKAKPVITSVLKGVDLTIKAGEQIAILGQSAQVKVPCCIYWRC